MGNVVTRSLCVGITLLWSGIDPSQAASDRPPTQITLMLGTTPGAGYDLYGRIFATYYSRYLPGSPRIVPQNMPIADGSGTADLLYRTSPRDGSVIGISPAGIVLTEILKPGKFGYKSAELNWIGTISTITDVIAVVKTTGVATIEDAKHKQVVLGAGGPLGPLSMYPTLSNKFLGTTFRVVEGYPGGREINMAMDSGEVQGRDNQWDSWLAQRPDLVADHKLNYLLQVGPKSPDLKGVPELSELVRTPEQKAVVDLAELTELVGRSIYTTPGVPAKRLAAMRTAFDQTMNDPDYQEAMKKAKLDVFHRPGAALQADLGRILGSSGPAGAELRAVLNVQ
jgi:tripartite-type tricarboxylate transporter receptor subunit TctC